MADQKLSDLTADASPLLDSLLYTVDNPGGTPVSRQSTIGEVFTNYVGLIGSFKINGTTKVAGYYYSGTSNPTNSNRLNYDGYLYATRVYNAVFNDIADFQQLNDEHAPGKCYRETNEGLKICTERCQLGVVGIYSDTYGYGLGVNSGKLAPIAVAGWVLAFVDSNYVPGTPLTNDENGYLTEMTIEEKRNFPERLMATYKIKEKADKWGTEEKINVNNRHWVKVR